MSDLLIKMEDGSPVNHPVLLENLIEFIPDITKATAGDHGYAIFYYAEKPSDTPSHTYASQGYTVAEDGTVTETFTAIAKDTPDTSAQEIQVRRKRDRLLAETDWVAIKALEAGSAVPADMVTYRTALRDLPDHANFPFLEEADWPTKP